MTCREIQKRMDIPIRLRSQAAHMAGQTMVTLAVSQHLDAQNVALLPSPYQTVFGPFWIDGRSQPSTAAVVPSPCLLRLPPQCIPERVLPSAPDVVDRYGPGELLRRLRDAAAFW